MFAKSSGGDADEQKITKLEEEKLQLTSQLSGLDERGRELDTREQVLEGEASELEGRIRELAKEESILLQRKKDLKQRAVEIGNSRTEILGKRKQFQREKSSLQSTIASLDGQLGKIQQQMEFEETQKSASVQVAQDPIPDSKPENQRTHPRAVVEVEVSMHTEHNFYTGLTENLSEGGLFVATYENLPLGTVVALTVKLPDHEPFQAEGTVRWVREHSEFTEDVSPGVGVQFTELSPADQSLVEKFIQARTPLFYETV